MKRTWIVIFTMTIILATFAPVTHAQDDSTTLFITDDGRFSVELPKDWVAAGDVRGLQVGTRPELLETNTVNFQPGDKSFIVMPFAVDTLAELGIPEGTPMNEIADFLFKFVLSNTPNITIQPSGEVEYADGNVIRAIAYTETQGWALHLYEHLAPGFLGIRVFSGPRAEFGEGEEIEMLTIAHTVQFSLELTEFATASDGAVSFAYPTGYITVEDRPTVHFIYNSEATRLAREAGENTAPGQVLIVALVVDPSQFESVSNRILKAIAEELATQLSEDSTSNPVLGEPVLLEDEGLIGRTVVLEVASDRAEGGVVVVYHEAAGVIAALAYAGALDEGHQLMLTTIAIANSMRMNPQ